MAKKPTASETNGNPPLLVCTPRRLPESKLIEAAEHAVRINPVNHAPLQRMMRVMPGFQPDRLRIAVVTSKYWGQQGVHLSVGFFSNPSRALREKILHHMNIWSRRANASFSLHSGRVQNADVRIAFAGGDTGGYWSYLGTDIELIEREEATMNLEGFSEDTPDSEYRRVVCHETGHTLGFPHEHLRGELVDKIDKDKAIVYFKRTQGWSEDEVKAQVLTPIEEASLLGTPHADPFSIMCYQIPGEITVDGKPIVGGTQIDREDEDFAAKIYPKVEHEIESTREIGGEQSQARCDAEDAAVVEILPEVTRITLRRPRADANPKAHGGTGGNLPAPSKMEIAPQVDEKLNKARRPLRPLPLPINDDARIFEDLGIGEQNHSALSLSFSNISRRYSGGLSVTPSDADGCSTRSDCVTLVHRRANGLSD